ncbi:hypothetical protein BASA60_001985 [Batrachochytrium salamandrivorans]|nr:hypothetical protein BASA60_001985 [Batrachochytrium salamandrivorans]
MPYPSPTQSPYSASNPSLPGQSLRTPLDLHEAPLEPMETMLWQSSQIASQASTELAADSMHSTSDIIVAVYQNMPLLELILWSKLHTRSKATTKRKQHDPSEPLLVLWTWPTALGALVRLDVWALPITTNTSPSATTSLLSTLVLRPRQYHLHHLLMLCFVSHPTATLPPVSIATIWDGLYDHVDAYAVLQRTYQIEVGNAAGPRSI